MACTTGSCPEARTEAGRRRRTRGLAGIVGGIGLEGAQRGPGDLVDLVIGGRGCLEAADPDLPRGGGGQADADGPAVGIGRRVGVFQGHLPPAPGLAHAAPLDGVHIGGPDGIGTAQDGGAGTGKIRQRLVADAQITGPELRIAEAEVEAHVEILVIAQKLGPGLCAKIGQHPVAGQQQQRLVGPGAVGAAAQRIIGARRGSAIKPVRLPRRDQRVDDQPAGTRDCGSDHGSHDLGPECACPECADPAGGDGGRGPGADHDRGDCQDRNQRV